VGSAVVSALLSRGHQVVAGARSVEEGAHGMHVDFMQPVAPAVWADRLREREIEAVVNCVGILIPGRGQSFERIHSQGPIELFRGAAAGGVRRVVQVSALGVGSDARSLATPYLHSKLLADDALAGLRLEWAVMRPSLVFGPRSQSGRLFATLASLPVIGLPGRGEQQVASVHVFELAEAIVRLLERGPAPNAVFEIGGAAAMSYRQMLASYREALGMGRPLWMPLPMFAMALGARLAETLPQKIFSRDTLRMLERGSVPAHNDLPMLLGRAASSLAHGLGVSPPEPFIDLRVALSPAVELALRSALAFMWLYTSLISALMPHESGVLHLLARCGFEGAVGIGALIFSCSLNVSLGALTLLRPTPLLYAAQVAAVLGYTATAAFNMPELTIDHCGPLVKNLPVLMTVIVLWLDEPGNRGVGRSESVIMKTILIKKHRPDHAHFLSPESRLGRSARAGVLAGAGPDTAAWRGR
jgi:nucleoside-diphosphate-sugar epimerase